MAYPNLLSLENVIAEVNRDRFPIPPLEKEHIISINESVTSFRDFLENFPQKAENLEPRIRDVAVEAENIIECFLEEELYTKWIAKTSGIHQLQRVKDVMKSMAKEVKDIQLGDSAGAISLSQVADTGDLTKIRDKLCGREQQLQYLPIFGMGGIGKTTLARKVYNDPPIKERFDVRVWLTISQDYSAIGILLNLLDSLKEFDPDGLKEYAANRSKIEIEEKVRKILFAAKRFLIVMDDIWSTKVLDDVKYLFPATEKGSRIMFTTRLNEVATYVNSSALSHEMQLMNEEQSWNLLRQKVFIDQDQIPRELEITGREIARSCGGLPLAIVVIAGLLMASQTLNSWKEVARNIRSSLAAADGRIENILSLSYNHMPHHLRPCFLYMGGYPEDHEIKVTELIRLWIAESFVRSVVSKEFEDTAEEYLEDLFKRNLILVTKRKSNGKIKSCRLHDMVREKCIKLSEEDKFLFNVKGVKPPPELLKSKRISIYHSNLYSLTNIHSSTIRSIIYFEHTLNSFGGFILLRVLDLLRAQNHPRSLSDQLFKLFHLRYLAFGYSYQIPRTISNLQSLQTLIIKDISDSCLPDEIWDMPELRHLLISKLRLPDTNDATSALENLQTLGKVENLICSLNIIKLIPNLTKLWLKYSNGSGVLLFDNLVHLSRLEKLHLELGNGWLDGGKPNLVVPSSVKKLSLIGWGIEETYLGIVGPFPNLEVLKLKSFNFMLQEWRTTDEGYFPQLEFLLIEDSNLTQWGTESSHFPKLKALHIRYCLELTKIPKCFGETATIESIELKLCRESLVESVNEINKEVQDCGNDAIQVRCIGCISRRETLEVALRQQQRHKRVLSADDYVGATSSSQDLIEIKDKLCGRATQLQYLPIFGMGGIGKTTLARNAYDDQFIMEHFQIRAWVTISQDYSKSRILSDLIHSVKEFNPDWRREPMVERSEHYDSSEMVLKLRKVLFGRKFLIVVDDIWSTDVLDYVKYLIPNDDSGSRIILTTRLTEVVKYANPSILPHEMRLMNADQSWNLLWQKVSVHQQYHLPRELESIGRNIAKSCGGLPIAIVVIAELLSMVGETLTAWMEIARNTRSYLSRDGQIEKMLSLSYNHLPNHLRPCFLYIGGFPQDHEIKVTTLIGLWIAEGFVERVVSKELEDAAEEYLNDLVGRSLIIVTKRKSNGKLKYCRLHDLVREVCIKLSREEKVLVGDKGSSTTSNLETRQTLVINGVYDSFSPHEIWNMQQLRHLIISTGSLPDISANTPALENLQTLGVENLTCSVSTLKLIPNLTKLSITYSSGSGELLFHNLEYLDQLVKLRLELKLGWSGSGEPNLIVPRSLKKLTLIGWGRREPYLNIVGLCPNLEVLKLKSFNFMLQEWTTSDDEFPQLKFLLIEESNLRQWEIESSHFPRLKVLQIRSCVDLNEIPKCMADITTLESIELMLCAQSLADSAKATEEEAQTYGDDVFKVHCDDCMPIEELIYCLKSLADSTS